jgi:hypothetical protein
MPKSKTRTQSAAPWWLGGEEECPHCHHLYAYQVEVRCQECDGPSCPHCVSRHVELGIVCMLCAQSPPSTKEKHSG